MSNINPKGNKPLNKRKSVLSSSSQVNTCEMFLEDNSMTNGATDCVKQTTQPKPSLLSDELSKARPSKKRKILPDEIEVDITASEPPSKKELRLLKKGKPLPTSKSAPKPASKIEVQTIKPLLEKKSEFGIWIGNLSYRVTKDQIRRFLTDNSDILDDMIQRIHIPVSQDVKSVKKPEGDKLEKTFTNKGFAYVDFANLESVNRAVQLSEKLINGRRVLIKDKNSFEGRPLKIKEQDKNEGKPPNKRVFLGNLSFDVTEQSLKQQFEKCGPIKNMKIATFEDTGKCKGYAWIEFEDLEGAKRAVRGYISLREEENINSAEIKIAEESDVLKQSNMTKIKKPRKQWLNKLNGRVIRVEFAEESQIRYKKRFGKSLPNNYGENDNFKASTGKKIIKPFKTAEYRQPYAPRLTGGIIESKGIKITF